MKKNVGWLVLVLSFSEGWAGEEPYDFRKRLEVVHQADRRDPAAKCAADEYEIADGFRIGIAADAGDFVYRVARDFEDYLAVSMKVCASVVRGTGDLTLALDGVDGFRIEDVVLKDIDITVTGAGEEASRKALETPVPYKFDDYPTPDIFWPHIFPAYGLYVDRADNVRLENVRFHLADDTTDVRPELAGIKVR